MSLIQEGIKAGLISISEDEKQIIYLHQNKKRNFQNQEEKVQAETFLKLVLTYKYSPERIKQFVTVKMGRESKEADIVVYNDDECTQPHILVECKSPTVSEQEFLQAIEQAYSYAYAMPNDVKYVWVTGPKNEYFEVDKKKNARVQQPDIPQYGVKKLANYKYVYDAESVKQETGKQKFFDLKEIDQSELTRRFKQAHDALWAGGQLNPSEAFDELDKLIFCKIWDERKDRKPGQPYDFQIITVDKEDEPNLAKRRDKENRTLYERVKALYEQGRVKDPEVFRDDIRLTPEKVRTVVGYLEDINLGETDLDSKGRAFETFMDSFFRGNFGQYFTPRPIVKFATDVLPITNESLVLDTSCGSGGFLLYALNKVRRAADELYPNYKTNANQRIKHYRYWHDFAENNLYGIEINEQISRAAKMNMIIHDDGHTNVITADGLMLPEDIQKITSNKGFKYNRFNFIITNPPFGSSVRRNEKSYMKAYDYAYKFPDWLDTKAKTEKDERDNQSTEVMFLEQCHKYLVPGGYLAVVVPDGILTNSSLQYVRDGIEDKYRIVAVVSMPQTAFTANGAGVKSSVLFLKKYPEAYTDKLKAQKEAIQQKLKTQYKYRAQLDAWEKEKTKKLKDLDGLKYDEAMPLAELKKTEAYKEWKEELNSGYADMVNELKEQLMDAYLQARQQELPDYSIFMAIAEDIGYDASGKPTRTNELDAIAIELTVFINEIENGRL